MSITLPPEIASGMRVSEQQIFIINKHWAGGRLDFIEAHLDENKARMAAGQLMGNGYTIGLTTTILKGSFIKEMSE